MSYFVPIYVIITAFTVVLAVMATKLLFAFYVVGTALLAVGAGDELRTVFKSGTVIQRLSRAIIAVIMFLIALWMGVRCSIDLYRAFAPGTLWAVLGLALGFIGEHGYIQRRVERNSSSPDGVERRRIRRR